MSAENQYISSSSGFLKIPGSADRLRSDSNVSAATYNGSYPLLDEPINLSNRRSIFSRRTSHSLDLESRNLKRSASKTTKFSDNLISDIPQIKLTSSSSTCHSSHDTKGAQTPTTYQISQHNNASFSVRTPNRNQNQRKSKTGRMSLRIRNSVRNRNMANTNKVPAFGSLKKFASSLQFREGLFRRTRTDSQSDELSLSEHSNNEFIGGEEAGFRHPRASTSTYLKEQLFAFLSPADNKLAMKLFGNKNALLKEKQRQQDQGNWIIHPCSSFRFYWDLLMLIMLIANLIILPVTISFFNDDLNSKRMIFNIMSDTIFFIDIGVNFRTGVIMNDFADEIILKPKLIAQHYLKTWFIVDLLSTIPVDYIFVFLNNGENFNQFMQAGRALRILRLAKLLSLLRLLRLSRLVRYVSQWEEFFNTASKFIGIFNLVLLMLLLGHWNACLQFLIPVIAEYPSDSWIIKCDLKYGEWSLHNSYCKQLTNGSKRKNVVPIKLLTTNGCKKYTMDRKSL